MRDSAATARAIVLGVAMAAAGIAGALLSPGASGAWGAAGTGATGPRAGTVASSGRFTASVELDGGVFSVVPARRGERPHVTRDHAAAKIWASPALEGAQAGPLGYGLVTITLRVHGIPRVARLLAWVGFARHSSAYSCPAQVTAPPRLPTLPSDGYTAVVIGAAHGSPAVVYTARSAVCGTLQPATLSSATESVSVPWRATGTLSDGQLHVQATVPPCGTVQGVSSGGNSKSTTITVAATVPDLLSHCGGSHTVAETVQLGPIGNPPGAPPPVVTGSTQILHGPLGPLHLALTR